MKPLNDRTSAAMAKVRQSRTNPEDAVASVLRELGVSYRRNVRTLPGKPDFANRSRGWVIQVHGCFWHQHNCKRGTIPTHNRDAWLVKFARNKKRDLEVEAVLKASGLRVLAVWECETRNRQSLVDKLAAYLG